MLSTDVTWTTVHTWKFEREVWAVTFISLVLSNRLTVDAPSVWVLKVDGIFPHLTYQSSELPLLSSHHSLPSPNFSAWSDSTNSKYRGDISNSDISRIQASVNHNKIFGHKSRASVYWCNVPFQQFCFSSGLNHMEEDLRIHRLVR